MKFERKVTVLFTTIILTALVCSANAYETKTHRFLACEALRRTQLELPEAYMEFAQNARCNDCTTLHACSGFSLKDAEQSQSRMHQRLDSVDEWSARRFCYFESSTYNPPAYYPYGSKAYFYEGDDLVNGASDEDAYNEHDPRTNLVVPSFVNHFWDPDVSSSESPGDFDGGLSISLHGTKNVPLAGETCHLADQPECAVRQASYSRAVLLWQRAVTLYSSGNKREAYYILGRAAHLLMDLTVPAHVHRDQHGGFLAGLFVQTCCGGVTHADDRKDTVELAAKDNKLLADFKMMAHPASYKFEALPFEPDWSGFGEHGKSMLFRLFWFTGQKTQYWASLADKNPAKHESFTRKDCEANEPDTANICIGYSEGELGKPNIYFDKDGNIGYLPEDLWDDPDVDEVFERPCEIHFASKEEKEVMTKGLMKHALSAVSGLYRLFWDQTHDQDGDGYGIVTDCDDANSLRFPGNAEVCSDDLDNNCDSTVNENCPSFTITHNPWNGDGHPHILYDIRVGESGTSTLITLGIEPIGNFTESVLLRVAGLAPDDSPVRVVDGSDDNTLPDDYGDGEADGPYNADFDNLIRPSFGSGAGSATKIVSAGGSTEFKLRRFPELPAGRYILKIEGVASDITRFTELVLVVGETTPGYTPR